MYLATGKAKDVLSRKHFDCEQDIDFLRNHEKALKDDLYELKVEFLGLKNDGGNAIFVLESVNQAEKRSRMVDKEISYICDFAQTWPMSLIVFLKEQQFP